jgi:hypothetical protein
MDIKEYQQGPLASSAVGVPRANTAWGDALGSIAQASAQIGGMVKERQSALDKVEAAKLASDYELASYQILNDHQTENSADPKGKTDALRAKLQAKLDDTLKNTKTKDVFDAVNLVGTHVIGNTLMSESKWAHEQESVIAVNQITDTVNSRASQAGQFGAAGQLDKLPEMLGTTQLAVAASRGVLGEKVWSELDTNTPKIVANSFINEYIHAHPVEAAVAIEQGHFNITMKGADGKEKPIFSTKDIQGFKDAARSRVENLSKEQSFKVDLAVLANSKDLADKFIQSKLTFSDIEALPPGDQRNTFTDLYLKANPWDTSTIDDAYETLLEKHGEMLTPDKKRIKDSVKFEDLIRYQNEVTTARTNKLLSNGRYSRLMQLVTPTLSKDTNQMAESWGSKLNPWGDDVSRGYASINTWSKSLAQDNRWTPEVLRAVKMAMVDEYIDQVDKAHATGGEVDFAGTVNGLIKKWKAGNGAGYEIGDIRIVGGIPFKMKGFDYAGKPQWEDIK